jgi:PIN domain nuclease of toxin-antitoxin system
MMILLDTHVFIWLVSKPKGLSRDLIRAVSNAGNSIHVSAVSFVEIAVKSGSARSGGIPFDVQTAVKLCERAGYMHLPLTAEHATLVADLPLLHSDPFDRLLVAQATAEKMVFATRDSQILRYAIKTLEA